MIQKAKIVSVSVNPNQYHQTDIPRCTVAFPMSSTSLKQFALCPSKYKAGIEETENDSMNFGQLIDCLALNPEQFNSRFAVQPSTYTNDKGEVKKWSNNSNSCKAWLADHSNKQVVTTDELAETTKAIFRLSSDTTIAAFIKNSDTQVWVSAEWKDNDTGLLVPLRCLIDLVPKPDSEFALCIGDMKTTRDASIQAWTRDVFKFGYHIQGAFNLDLFNATHDEERTTFCHIVQENTPPYEPGKRLLDQEFIEIGRNEYRAALANYCKCLKFNSYPGYDDTDESSQGWSNTAPEPWMANKATFDPKYIF